VDVLEQVRRGGLLPAGSPVVAMLSGGRDSVCLLDVVVSLCGSGQVRALHVNYGLRDEAEGDQRHCERLCERLRVALEIVRAERPPGAGNVQAWAREVRYEAALRLAADLDADLDERDAPARDEHEEARPTAVVAVGHTATDQVETILYRLAASPGRRALLGMSAREGRIVRPLLGITREQTAAHCIEQGLAWREDASNESDAYARARVRHGLLPALRAVHPGADGNVLRTAELLRQETELLEQLVDAELRESDSEPGGQPSLAIERLRELHPALARLIVVRLAEQAAGPGVYVPQAGDRVAEILELAARQGRAELHIGGLVAAVIADGRLRMVKIAAHFPPPDAE
jgi:tRNA(Ile)-lysidine synthase